MDWKFCDISGNLSENPTWYQIDTVGNIVQRMGGIVPKACQKCKEPFKSENKDIPIKKSRKVYKCQECDFINTSAEAAFDHKLEKDHKFKKESVDVITNVKRISVGIIPRITKTEDDVIILCNNCENGNI